MDRRTFLSMSLASLSPTFGDETAPALRGTLDPNDYGIDGASADDQSAGLQRALNDASAVNRPLFLPPGRYIVSNLVLPARTRLSGVPGATEIVFGGNGHLMVANQAERIELSGLVIDGANLPLADYVPATLHIQNCPSVTIESCAFHGSMKSALALDRSGGRVSRSSFAGAFEAGIRVVESTGLVITDNAVAGCGNGGILVYRWRAGEDGTLVTGNRIERIGTGDADGGCGVRVFRAHGVAVSGNRIADCAVSAICVNAADNVQVSDNSCLRSGGTGISAEFGASGALIANNIVDTAASGISLANLGQGGRLAAVTGNVVRNITGKGPDGAEPSSLGIGIAVEADAAATGNLIDGAPRFGMMLGWGTALRDVVATGNVIRRAPVGIAVSVVEGAGAAMVSDNLISGASRAAILGLRFGDEATGDLALTGARAFPHLMIDRNRTS